MSKFKVGDKVKIVGPLDREWVNYVGQLQDYVGKTGEVLREETGEGVCVFFEHDNDDWYFKRENIQHVLSEAEFIKKQIKQLKKRLKEIENE